MLRRTSRPKLRLGDAWGLEVQLKELRVLGLGHNAGRTNRLPRNEWHAQTDHAAKAIEPQKRDVPRDGGNPNRVRRSPLSLCA